jgi:dTDP-L-rhamnose 4-epimerase
MMNLNKLPLENGKAPGRDQPVQIMITGGAGFIGSHLSRRLLQQGFRVRILDNLTPQVHGPERRRPGYLEPDAELVVGDVRDPDAVRRALAGCDAVVHLAARVGVGQSMYELADYTAENTYGTAVLLEALVERPVRKLVVASSMSIYGEGLYRGADGRPRENVERLRAELERGIWEPHEPHDPAGTLQPLPTPEWKRPALASIYALGKYEQERMCLLVGETYEIPTVALRFFNVYGTDQALSNPYTGVLAIFASRMLNGRPPRIFEDGNQRRDFVSVHDVARACELALTRPDADGRALNIGSGHSLTVLEIAELLAEQLDYRGMTAELTGQYRVGDIRHCFADVTLARETLGFEAAIELDAGLVELAGWLEGQVAEDRVDAAARELQVRGLTR